MQVELLYVLRRRFQDHLQLAVLIEPVGVLSIAPVGRTARGLHVGNLIRLGAQDAQEGLRGHRTGPDLNVVGLLQHASALRPELLQAQDEFLKSETRFH